MAKTNKSGPILNGKKLTKHEAAKQIAKYLGDGTFEVDKNPPTMMGRFVPPEYLALREKIKKTVEATPVNMAFIVPLVAIGATKKYLKEDFEKFKFVVNHIAGNDKMMRIYKLKRDSK